MQNWSGKTEHQVRIIIQFGHLGKQRWGAVNASIPSDINYAIKYNLRGFCHLSVVGEKVLNA